MARKREVRVTKPPPARASRARDVMAWALLFAVYLALRGILAAVPIDRDEGAFGYIAQRFLHGELPYRDWCDLKPPGIFYVYTLVVSIFPPTTSGVHAFLLLWNLGTLLCVVSLGRALAGRRAGWWCGLFYALASSAPSAQSFKAGVEMIVLLPLVASVRVAVAASLREGWRRALLLVASGTLGAFACWIKQPVALSLLVIPAWYLARLRRGPARAEAVPHPTLSHTNLRSPISDLDGERGNNGAAPAPRATNPGPNSAPSPLRRLFPSSFFLLPCRQPRATSNRRSGRLLTDALFWLAGGAATSVLVCLPFLIAGLWHEMIYWSFTHPWDYARLPFPDALEVLTQRLAALAPELGVLLLFALAGGVWAALRRRPGAWLGLLFLGLSVASIFHSPFFYPHYFALVFPGLALAAGLAVAAVLDECARKGRAALTAGLSLVAAAAPLALLLGVRQAYFFPQHPARIGWLAVGPQDFEAAPELARYLREHMQPEDWMFVFGSEAQIAFLSQRRLANRYVMLYPLMQPLPNHRQFQERTWAFFLETKPLYVLVPPNPASRMEQAGTDPFFRQQFVPYVMQHYELEAVLLRADIAQYSWVMHPDPKLLQQEQGAVAYIIWRRKN